MKDYIVRAERALKSARLLYQAEDLDAATSRAYYAMHYGAVAILLATKDDPMYRPPKTHDGLIVEFGRPVVETWRLNPGLGRSLSRVERLRLRADYGSDEHLDIARVEWAIAEASEFLEAIKNALSAKD